MNNKKRKFAQDFSGESKTQQHFTDSCDVNNIVAHFQQTGVDPHADRQNKAVYGYASSQDFSDAMENVAEIQSKFAELPSEERSAFANDPARWLDSLTPVPSETPDEIPADAISEPLADTPPAEPAPQDATQT